MISRWPSLDVQMVTLLNWTCSLPIWYVSSDWILGICWFMHEIVRSGCTWITSTRTSLNYSLERTSHNVNWRFTGGVTKLGCRSLTIIILITSWTIFLFRCLISVSLLALFRGSSLSTILLAWKMGLTFGFEFSLWGKIFLELSAFDFPLLAKWRLFIMSFARGLDVSVFSSILSAAFSLTCWVVTFPLLASYSSLVGFKPGTSPLP